MLIGFFLTEVFLFLAEFLPALSLLYLFREQKACPFLD